MVDEGEGEVERFKRLEDLYHSALALTAAERQSFIHEVCAGDDDLRREVESLLAAQPQAAEFLSVPAIELEALRRAEQLADQTLNENQPIAPPVSLIGRAINQYVVVAPLGRGGMGEVWLVEDTHLKRKVALKLLPAEFTNDAGRVRRFELEAHAVLTLNHPNIITLFDFGHTDEGYFITTEFVDGQTLRARFREETRLPIRESIEIALQICAALDAAHRRGIIHRDIKPENLMLRRDGYVKVLDFGLAKITEMLIADCGLGIEDKNPQSAISNSQSTSPGAVMGTVSYMSPEQARGQKVNERTDIFSLGIVLYEMLTGHLPFEGETASEMLAAILKSEPPPLTEFLPDALPNTVNVALQQIIIRALIKDREARYHTIQAMADDLRKCAENLQFHELLVRSGETGRSQPSGPPPDSSVPISATQSTTHPRQKFIFALVLLALVVAIPVSLLVWRMQRSRPSPPTQASAIAPIQTLAVLPFRFIGSDRNEEYLGQGMTEALITKLGNARQLTVRPITAVLDYQNANVEPDHAARELKTDAVVLGSLQKVGGKLRVNVQLNRAGEAQPFWTGDFDGLDSDPFALQDEVALRLIGELSLILNPAEQQKLARRATTNPEAHRLYMQGRYFYYKWSIEGVRRARGCFERALEHDDKFAPTYIQLAMCWSTLGERGAVTPEESERQSLAFATKAVNIDETLADAQGFLGFLRLRYNWDLAGAGARFRRALELNPRQSITRQFHGVYLLARGSTEEAIAETKLAVELDPTSLYLRSQLGRALYLGRHYEEAIANCQEILQLDEKFSQAYVWLGQAYSQQGKYAAAIAALEQASRLDGGRSETKAALGHAYAVAGRAEEAQMIIKDFQGRSKPESSNYHIATIYAGLGDRAMALAQLEESYQRHDAMLMLRGKLDPKLDPLRNDPAFTSLLQRMGLATAHSQ
jgi:serine/threonine protein kinase/tetratricopeptide (TPR) repeat protein